MERGAGMTAVSGPATGEAPPTIGAVLPSTRWLVALLLPLAALKLAQLFIANPTPDEAYYWLWGQHPALSYFDHPPLSSWLQGLSASIFGWNIAGLRAPVVASFAGSLAILWFWSRRLAPEHAMRVFLAGTIAWLSMPVLMRFQSLAHQDHLLVLLGLATAHFLALFHESLDGERPRWRLYFAGCVMLGLAGLTKYNAVFLGLGFAAWVLATPKGRGLLGRWQLWAGASAAALMQAPVIAWNIENGWPSFRYNLEDRIGETIHAGFAGNLQAFAVTSVIWVSPVMIVALWRFVAGKGLVRTPFEPAGRFVLVLSTAAFAALCVSNTVLHYWNLAAYLFFLPVAVFYLKSRTEFMIHALYGIAMGVFIVVMQGIYPSYKANGEDVRDNDITFGWSEIARIVETEEARLKPGMVLTTDYRTASLLSFETGRSDIAEIAPRRDQFDFWFEPAAHKGETALVLVDDALPEDDLVAQVFKRVTPVRSFTIRRFGMAIHTYRLVLAEDYSGSGAH